ncbi:MAG: TlpA family protein disulfide reductase [Planctomycetes bacterium]|nr:TlpA family protein disulfide reductase [Planctomycetota bacterium]
MKRTTKSNSRAYLVTIGLVVGLLLIVVISLAPDLMNRNASDEVKDGLDTTIQVADQGRRTAAETEDQTPTKSATTLSAETSKKPLKTNPLAQVVGEFLGSDKSSAIKLQDVVSGANWMPVEAHEAWFGRAAPGFSVVDIDGKQHRLADFKGKQVVIALWAPSVAHSVSGLQTFGELRATLPPEELVVLGISFDGQEQVKRTLKRAPGINYPIVAAEGQAMPAPYSTNTLVPGAIFIEADGTFKISIHGTIPLEEMKRLLRAG